MGQVVRIHCQAMAHRGLGVGRLGRLVVFLFGALPGEEVSAQVTKVRRHHAEADTVQVHEASPQRVAPPCPYFGSCGGCQLQHASYPLQLQLKQGVLQELLERQGLSPLPEIEMRGAPNALGYRWRGEFHRAPGEPPLGFRSRGGRRLVPVADCLIHHQTVRSALEPVGRALQTLGPEVRTVHLTVGEEGRQLLLQTRPERARSRAAAVAAAPALGEVQVTDESTGLNYRQRQFRVFAGAFIQVNQGALPLLYESVVDFLEPGLGGAEVIDAYGGVGVLATRLLEAGAGRVTLIESEPLAARLGQLHAEMYGGGHMEVLRRPVEAELERIARADAVVLDPPRAGLSAEVRSGLCRSGPPTIVYLSCEPAALARDLRQLLSRSRYRLERLCLIDMFPQTYHFETAALLRRT
ncbi:MAG: class I SAM-dependent RNA methyltransferase [Candidatus Dormibacteria bacterium]